MAAAGDKLIAVASVSNRQNTDGSTTSTTYTATLAGGTAAGVAFVAPPTGKVTVLFVTAGYNSGLNDNKSSVRVREGASVGSGTIVHGATDADLDNDMILHRVSSDAYRLVGFTEVTGLTAGNTYNAQMLHRVSAGTGNFLFKFIKVIPDL